MAECKCNVQTDICGAAFVPHWKFPKHCYNELPNKLCCAHLEACHSQPSASAPMVSDEIVDQHLDAVLRASGSALRHYTMASTLAAMRQAMRTAIASTQSPEGK
jgi:hypothetical protein